MWPTMSMRSFFSAAAIMRSQSASVRASGFSTRTCLPALRAATGRSHVVIDVRDDADCLDLRIGQQFAIVADNRAARAAGVSLPSAANRCGCRWLAVRRSAATTAPRHVFRRRNPSPMTPQTILRMILPLCPRVWCQKFASVRILFRSRKSPSNMPHSVPAVIHPCRSFRAVPWSPLTSLVSLLTAAEPKKDKPADAAKAAVEETAAPKVNPIAPPTLEPVKEEPITDYDRQHWAFQPLVRREPPAVQNSAWDGAGRNPGSPGCHRRRGKLSANQDPIVVAKREAIYQRRLRAGRYYVGGVSCTWLHASDAGAPWLALGLVAARTPSIQRRFRPVYSVPGIDSLVANSSNVFL